MSVELIAFISSSETGEQENSRELQTERQATTMSGSAIA